MATSASPYPSPASSSSSLAFPRSSSPVKESLRSNPHPYAIKTTSTGILTRSNSTHSSSSTPHHFVPSSPTKPKANHPRPSGHRYSRSLNAELPRPLPIPPNFPSSPSPTRAEFDAQDVTPITHRERRADGLPDGSQPNVIGGGAVDGLPDDPRVWTPSDLSMYLSSSLRVTSGDLPSLVAQDVVSFVRTQKITGRKFLRLTEGDLDKYGLNQRWQSALLEASRALRQDSLRGRIWHSGFPPDRAEQEDGNDSYSSTSSLSSSGSMNDSRTGKRASVPGRVKGMVASFERSGPSRSVSPDKGPSSVKRMDSLKHSSDPETDSAAINPIQSRPRPQSDIFPSRSSYAMAPASEDTATATNGDTERKKEPRLLPYPPSQQNLPEYTAFGTSPQSNNIQGMSTFGPYDSTQDASFAPFPSGVLPFSPQSTGTTIPSPSPSDHLDQYGQPQSFDALYTNTFVDGVRPLPLPPHPGQMYQPPVSMQGYGGAVIDDVNYVSENGVYSPHGQHHHHHIVTAPVPHVQVQHVPGEPSHVQTPVVDVDIDQQQQQQPLHQLLQPRSQPVLPILAPQPRHGGRESPTKLLEEKLEEILEPRPRSRVVSGAGISTSPSHSRVLESSSPSRPRSRVASMNLTGNANGSVRVGSRVPSTASLSAVMNGVGEKGGDVPDVGNGGGGLLGVGGPSHPHRTRVISLSSRTHSHRLSGVEVWGENHRHIVVPPDEELDVQYNAEEVNVKEVEGEEEVGIEALLEKETPDLSMPVPEENGNGNGNGHGREGSGSGSTGSVVHSRAGSLREPKSAVITVVERKPSARLRRDEAGVGGGEESMEALLAKADSASVRKKMNGNGNGKRRTPLSGVEAWEMINVDTVKHVEGDGMGRSIEDIFSPVPVRPPTPSHARVQARARASPSPPKTKLKPKDKSDEAGRLDELDKKEKELERSVGETRRMVEEIRGRLGSVERWIAEKERLAEVGLESEKRREEERRNGGGGVGIVGWPVDVVKRVLSASRVPGMLGLSAWLGVGPSSEPSSASENRQDTQTRMRKETLVRRCARLGLGLSTYAVLFGIGVCVALLRLLGKRPGLPARFGGAGAGVRMVNGALRG